MVAMTTSKLAKEQKETRERQDEVALTWREHRTAEVHAEFDASTNAGEDKSTLPELHAQDGYVLLDSHGPARLDREQFIVFRKKVEQAFQVVA